jgi:hypothetical protein
MTPLVENSKKKNQQQTNKKLSLRKHAEAKRKTSVSAGA